MTPYHSILAELSAPLTATPEFCVFKALSTEAVRKKKQLMTGLLKTRTRGSGPRERAYSVSLIPLLHKVYSSAIDLKTTK